MPEPLVVWSRDPGPAALLRAARARLEAGQRGDRLTLDVQLDDQQRRVVSQLLGLVWLGSAELVTMGRLRRAFERYEVTVQDVVAACAGGPIVDARAARASARAELTQAADRGRQVLRDAGVADAVIDAAFARRWLGSPQDREQVCRDVAVVWRAFPAAPGTLLATFASDLFGDPHALDRDTVTGRAVSRLVAASGAARRAGGGPRDEDDATSAGEGDVAVAGDVAVMDAVQWRAAWAEAGVTCDRVSSTVLVLNLSFPTADVATTGTASDSGARRLVQLCSASAGEPLWLTSRVLATGLTLAAGLLTGVVVRVCENPSVVEAAADAYGHTTAPLVCTYGWPSGAARVLLEALTGAGAQVLVSADRDAVGEQISSLLLKEFPTARPWLPDAVGVYEEDRLTALLSDLH